jgi:hypothetical protein
MTRFLLATAVAISTAGIASAQFAQPYGYGGGYGGYGPGGYGGGGYGGGFGYSGGYSVVQPNIYNPVNQPLSPYLNLLGNGGGNIASRYYYGVRPGTMGGFGQGGIGAPFTAFGGNRPLFFPQLASAPDPDQPREVGVGDVLPPAGHPVMFNNTAGYFPSPFGYRGGARSGLGGLGMTRPPARR